MQQGTLPQDLGQLQSLGSGPSMMTPHSMNGSLLIETMNKMCAPADILIAVHNPYCWLLHA